MKPFAFLSTFAIMLVSLSASAQTFYGSGAATNTAPNTDSVGIGYKSLSVNSGKNNTSIGSYSLFSNTTGYNNTANGSQALYNNTMGYNNTATGYCSLGSNTTGYFNTANGYCSLFYNTTGYNNTATGLHSLYKNTVGTYNTATGFASLCFNTTGNSNVANGVQALYSNTEGNFNTAIGSNSLYFNTTGYYNTATGINSLRSNTTGYVNLANGAYALYSNTTGYYNTAIGNNALYKNTKGKGNIALGQEAGSQTTGSNNIEIGNMGLAGDSGTIRIGDTVTHTSTYIAGINGVTSSNGVAVYINSNGQLGTVTSSRRFKKDIKSMGSKSDKLMNLHPVTFRYKEDGSVLQYGLIAEEVAKVAPDLVQYDKQGKPFTVRYHLLTPMLINELQKERAARKALEAKVSEVATLKAKIASLEQVQSKQLAELAKQVAALQVAQQKGKTALAGLH